MKNKTSNAPKMTVGIQSDALKSSKAWSDLMPVWHHVNSWEEAVSLAYAISKQNGYATVRLTDVSKFDESLNMSCYEYAGRVSGTYIQYVPTKQDMLREVSLF